MITMTMAILFPGLVVSYGRDWDDVNAMIRAPIGIYGKWRSFDYKYRVVTDKIKIDAGDIVRVLNQDGSIRGSGVVINPMLTDYLNYGQIWLE